MSKKTETKKQGRPPKTSININENHDVNINIGDIIPASKIPRIPQMSPINLQFPGVYAVHLCCSPDGLESLTKMMEVIHGITKDHCTVSFDSSGMIFQKKSNSGQLHFDARLFSDRMISYYCEHPIAIKIDPGILVKFLKNFKSKLPFYIFIYKEGDTYEIKFETVNVETNVKRTYTIDYIPIEISEVQFAGGFASVDYEMIVLLNSEFFVKECKDMKGLSQTFEIFCNNNGFQINIDREDLSYRGIQGLSNSIKYLKGFKESFESINKELTTVSVFDYVKCEAFSKIIKFYLSNRKDIPVILEFDIDPEFGVFQAFLY
jgi:hypothetical protein